MQRHKQNTKKRKKDLSLKIDPIWKKKKKKLSKIHIRTKLWPSTKGHYLCINIQHAFLSRKQRRLVYPWLKSDVIGFQRTILEENWWMQTGSICGQDPSTCCTKGVGGRKFLPLTRPPLPPFPLFFPRSISTTGPPVSRGHRRRRGREAQVRISIDTGQ